jgi:glycosyltransferase involved in cell wall biosynthesis
MPEQTHLAKLRERLGLEGKRVIATYGFLMPHKGIVELVNAMPIILEAEPTAHLLLVNASYSDAVSGPVIEKIESQIDELRVGEHVTLISDYLSDGDSMALLKLAEVVVFPHQQSDESSSAAARMAISGRCPTAITPISIFDDIAPACSVLPGVTPPEMAAGLVDLMSLSGDPDWQGQQVLSVDALAREMDVNELSARLLGMVQGHLRRVNV